MMIKNSGGAMISDERLKLIAEDDHVQCGDASAMAKELLALRKFSICQHHWNSLKLVECGGRYKYCTLCGAKKVAQ